MTDNLDPIAQANGAAKKCADCGNPTTFELLDPFDKSNDRPLCLKCLEREILLPVYLNRKARATVYP
jgi:hypothetical protein